MDDELVVLHIESRWKGADHRSFHSVECGFDCIHSGVFAVKYLLSIYAVVICMVRIS